MGLKLTPLAETIVRRGGSDLVDDDEMLFLELVSRAPGQTVAEYRELMIALRMEYGFDALKAIQSGYVKFELRSPRDRKDETRNKRDA